MQKPLNLVVACAENRVIGRNGRLPWHIPEDLAFFHAETAGNVCVLGRVCYDTWPRVHEDGRRPIVLTHRPLARTPAHERGGPPSPTHHAPIAVTSLAAALEIADALPGEICICGGQRIYEETLTLERPMRLLLTLVHAQLEGDTFFPEWRHLRWRELARRESADANYRYTFFTLERMR